MDDIVFSGKLEFLELPDLLQLIGNNGSSGVLRLKSPHAANLASIYIEKGNPVNASNGSNVGIKALLALFGWSEGTFEFSSATLPVKKVITKNRMEIILEGLRLMDDGKIEKIGPENTRLPTGAASKKLDGITVLKGPLVDYLYIVDEEYYHDDDLIVEEGKHGTWMWVVLEGTVEIVKQTPGGPMCLGMVSDGSFVGDIATFLAKEHVRGASAKARGTVQLGVIDSQRLANEFSTLSRGFRDALLSFDRRLKHASGNAMRIRLNQPLLADLQDDMTPFHFEEDDIDKIHIIKEGKAVVARPMGKDNVKVVMAELTPGDFLGRIPFLDTGLEPHSAEVLTSKDIATEIKDPAEFQMEYDRLSTTFKNIVKHISASISVTIQTAENAFSRDFSGLDSNS
jgi:CRP-like cAMP-binding protein